MKKLHQLFLALAVMTITQFVIFALRAASDGSFILSFINLAIVLLAVLLSYYHHEATDFFGAKRSLDRIRTKASKVRSKIRDEWQKRRKMNEGLLFSTNRAITLTILLWNGSGGYRDTLESIYKDAINKLRSNISALRARKGLPPVAYKEVKTLSLPSSSGHDADHDRSSSSHLASWTIGLTASLLVSFAGCGFTEDPASHEIVVVADWSIAADDSLALPTVEEQASYIFAELLNFNPHANEVIRDEIAIYASFIGETSFPPIERLAFLETGKPGPMMIVKDRIEAQKILLTQAIRGIELNHKLSDLPFSYVHSTLSKVLLYLANSTAANKKVLITSDLIENNNLVSFYELGPQILEKYDQIVAQLHEYNPELEKADLQGIDIIVAYQPDRERDEVARLTREFWKRYIGQRNGNIQFVARLPKTIANL